MPQELTVTEDSKEVTDILDWYTPILGHRLFSNKTPVTMLDGFLKKRSGIFRFPILEDQPGFSANSSPELNTAFCDGVYSKLQESGCESLVAAVPAIISRIDKEFLVNKIKKSVDSITAQDIQLMTTLYPEAVNFTTAYQFFIDIAGRYYQAHAEVFNNYTLSEYTVSPQPKSSVILLFMKARNKVFSPIL